MVPKKKLGEILLDEGLIDEIQLRSAIGHQKNWGGKLGSALLELGFITEDVIRHVLEDQLKQRCLTEKQLVPDPRALELMPMQDALRYTVLPLSVDGTEITLAMSNPFDLAVADEIGFKLGKKVKGVLAVEALIKKAIKKYYSGRNTGRDYKVELRSEDSQAEVIHYGNRREAKPAELKRTEPSPDLIAKAVAYLLIEKGIIKREELIEKMKTIKDKG
jgi:hypothetical protein